jgi:hypothetical protein
MSEIYSSRTKPSAFRPLSTNLEEQRHEGKPNLSITRNTRLWEPESKGRLSVMSGKGHARDKRILRSMSVTESGSAIGTNLGSDETTLVSLSGSSGIGIDEDGGAGSSGSKDLKGGVELDADMEKAKRAGTGPPNKDTDRKVEEDDNVYPGPLGLIILSIGLMLCVFLISLDRTIITTVSSLPFTFFRNIGVNNFRPFHSL